MPFAPWNSCGVVLSFVTRPRLLLARLPPLKAQAHADTGGPRPRYKRWEDEHIARRRQQGAGSDKIAEELGRSYHSVRKRRQKYGAVELELRNATGGSGSAPDHARTNTTAFDHPSASPSKSDLAARGMLSPVDRARLERIEELVFEGKPFSHIAKALGMSHYAAFGLFHRYNPRRKRYTSWSEDEVRKALSLRAAGHSSKQICAAFALQRSPSAVVSMFARVKAGFYEPLDSDRQDT